jgi:hypothetical protein
MTTRAQFVARRRTTVSALIVVLGVLLSVLGAAPVQAQAPVKPGVERAAIEIKRGSDVVQPPAVLYKRILDGEDAALVPGDSLGVLKIPRPRELDAIQYTDSGLGFAVNLQHAMIVRDGQVVDVRVSEQAVGRRPSPGASSVQSEILILRPPPEDAFDIAIPDGLECKRLEPGSREDTLTRGRLYGDLPCKQVAGVETVVDVKAWYEASMTNSLTGQRAVSGTRHNARELRGWLRSLARDGEQVRFVMVATPPERTRIAERAPTRLDTIVVAPIARIDGVFRIEHTRASNFEWVTTLAALTGPNRTGLPGSTLPRYASNRIKGDAITSMRFNVSDRQRYEVTFFGSTQASLSDHAAGNHHDVPYGLSLAARFGEKAGTAFEVRLEGSYEDDPFQRNTLSTGDQRVRLLLGVDHGSILTEPAHLRLSAGPTYFVDRTNIWEVRSDGRQLGLSARGTYSRNVHLFRLPAILTVGGHLDRSWGYIRDTGNRHPALSGRFSAKPRFRLGGTTLAVGPVLYLAHTRSAYPQIDGFAETDAQFGLEMTSWITF